MLVPRAMPHDQHRPHRWHTVCGACAWTHPSSGTFSVIEGEYRVRRESHRAVERRRRDQINSGIDELGRLVPGMHRSKGKTVHRAVHYLRHVRECEDRFNQQGVRLASLGRARVRPADSPAVPQGCADTVRALRAAQWRRGMCSASGK